MQRRHQRVRINELRGARVFATIFLLFAGVSRSMAQIQEGQTDITGQGRRIVVSIPHRELAFIENGKVQEIYPVAVGSPRTPSPTGMFQIRNRLEKPTYYHPGKVVPAGPGNPLGTRWIGLSTKGYGIHGTNVESSIGKAASHGCIRMHRKDLEQLFALVQVGDEVEIRAKADDELASIFGALPNAVNSSGSATIVVNGQ